MLAIWAHLKFMDGGRGLNNPHLSFRKDAAIVIKSICGGGV